MKTDKNSTNDGNTEPNPNDDPKMTAEEVEHDTADSLADTLLDEAAMSADDEAAGQVMFCKLRDDIRKQAQDMAPGCPQARLIVDSYWRLQRRRIVFGQQSTAVGKKKGENSLLDFLEYQSKRHELEVNTLMKEYATHHQMGQWAMKLRGIGHGIASTLLAYIDPVRAQTAGNVWAYFGYDPTKQWLGAEKAAAWVAQQTGTPEEVLRRASLNFHRRYESLEKAARFDNNGRRVPLTMERVAKAISMRPWNPRLKQMGYLIGSCLLKADSPEYAPLYHERKEIEQQGNEQGMYADTCKRILAQVPDHAQGVWYAGCYTVEAARKIREFHGTVGEKKAAFKADLVAKIPATTKPAQRKAKMEKINTAVTAYGKKLKKELELMERKLAGKPGSGVPMLPVGHIHMRAQRWMVKQFLSDYQAALYKHTFNREPPAPYAIAILGHAHRRGETVEEGRTRWAAKKAAAVNPTDDTPGD